MSLDGVLEDLVSTEDSGLGDWTGPYTRGAKGDAFKHAELVACESILLGSRTYDGFDAVWPTADDEAGFAKQINSMPKDVVSTTLKTAEGNNSTIIDKGVVERAKALKSEPGGDMLVWQCHAPAYADARWPGRSVQSHDLPDCSWPRHPPFPQDWNGSLILDKCTEFGSGIVMLRSSAI